MSSRTPRIFRALLQNVSCTLLPLLALERDYCTYVGTFIKAELTMVLHSRSSGDDMSDAQVVWNASSYQSSEYPADSFIDSIQLSNESYDTISKEETFSVGTRTTHNGEGSVDCYTDEESQASEHPEAPPKQSEPTVFVLQHHIAPVADPADDSTEDARDFATREEQETGRAESKKEAKSFSRFRKQFGKKKKEHDNGDREPAPTEETETDSDHKPSKTKKTMRGKGFLLSAKSRSKPSVKEEEQPSSSPEQDESEPEPSRDKRSLREKGFLRSRSKSSQKEGEEEPTGSQPRLELVSSSESKDDDREEESTVGGTLNTFDFNMFLNLDDPTMDDYTRDSSTQESSLPSKPKDTPARRSSSTREASTVAATAESSPSRDDLSAGMTTDDGEKSVRSTKSNRSSRSNRSNVSIRSFGSIFKRKSREGSQSDLKTTKSNPEEGNGMKRKRSWNPLRRKRSSKKASPPTTMKKPVSNDHFT